MKKSLLTIGFLFCLVAFTTAPNPGQLILGKWKIDESSLEKTARAVVETTRKSNPDVADQMDQNFSDLVEMMKGIQFTYKADSTYEVETPQGVQGGRYIFLNDGKNILYTPDGRAPRKDSVLELSTGRLRLINRERGDTTLFVRPKE